MLVFPHTEISNILEKAAMQLAHGRDESSVVVKTALNTSYFQLGEGPNGETVLILGVGETGMISFILPPDMERELCQSLGEGLVRH
jgi:hypothetical protein